MIAAALLLGQVAQQAKQARTVWTAREIAACKEALTYCWLLNRPLDLMPSADRWNAARAKVREHIAKHCAGIITAALSESRDRHLHYADENTKTAEHYRTHPEVLGADTDEMVERMRGYAKEQTREAQPYVNLIAKVQTSALPAPVLDFDPTTAGGA